MKIYMVGGVVRDQLLGLEPKDRDWVIIDASQEDVKYLESQGYSLVGADFPVYLHPTSGEEYALARRERKVGNGYNGFLWSTSGVSLEEDLSRRDLTINAMAIYPPTGEIIDPFNGQRDLKDGILRHVSPAFVEDPLRVLRVARFAARFGFNVDPDTMSLMSRQVSSGELDHLTAERVWKEFEKIFDEPEMLWGLEVLQQCGALRRLFDLELFDVDRFALERAIEVDAPIASLCAIFFNRCDLKKLESKIRFPSSILETIRLFKEQFGLITSFDKLPSLEKIALLKNVGALRQSLEFKYLMIACSIISSFRDWQLDIEKTIYLLKSINYEELLKNVPNSQKVSIVLNAQVTILERNNYVI